MGHLQPSFFMAFVKAQTVSETVSADFQTTLCFCPLCKYFLPCTFFIFQCSPPSFFLMAWNYFCFLTVTCSENCFLFLYIYIHICFSFSGEPLGLSCLVTCELLCLWYQTQGSQLCIAVETLPKCFRTDSIQIATSHGEAVRRCPGSGGWGVAWWSLPPLR